jgi:hypothetical protein
MHSWWKEIILLLQRILHKAESCYLLLESGTDMNCRPMFYPVRRMKIIGRMFPSTETEEKSPGSVEGM